MGLVTVRAPFLIQERPVNSIFPQGFVHHVAVATLAQPIPCSLRPKGIRRRGGFMALHTLLIRNRTVNVRKKDSRFVGTMRIMTGRTIRFSHGIIHVPLGKSRIVHFVALSAERDEVILQQVIRFGRPVGGVTIQARLLDRIVFESYLRNCIAYVFVTLEAEIISGF
jgi:hypothetical protein